MLENQINQLINQEQDRQQSTLSLIPSENYVSHAVKTTLASDFTNKYAEGYPGKRYYAGTNVCDDLELLCQEEAQAVFRTEYFANVQPYSGTPANLAAILALAKPGDTILGMNLSSGGHLSHGHKVSVTGKIFNSVQYSVDPQTNLIDYDAVAKLATEHKPKVIIAGLTAYPRKIDFARFSEIAQSVGAYLLADISHISGLVACGLHPTPFGYADVVMTTTHKMLRGPRGAILFSKTAEISKKIDKTVFPGLQGGPHMNNIAGIAQALSEAQSDAYHQYCQQILTNALAMARTFIERGFDLITNGTDNHLWVIDLRNKNITGDEAQKILEKNGVTSNKNTIPFDPAGPFKPSGLRLGTPAITTRVFNEADSINLANIIADLLENKSHDQSVLEDLITRHPIPNKQ